MAEFGANVTSLASPRGAGAEVIQPVRNNIGESIAQGIGMVADIFQKRQASSQQKEEGKIRSSYTRELRGIESAFRSGNISAQEATTRREKLKSDYSGAYPDFVEDFDEITTKFSKGTSLERAGKDVDDARARRNSDILAASKDGILFPPNADPIMEDQLVELHKKQTRARQDIQEYRDSAKFQWEQGRVTREQAERESKEVTQRNLNTIGATNIEMFNLQIEDLVKKKQQGMPYEQSLLALTKYHSNIQQQVNSVAVNFPDLAKHYGGMFDNMFNTAKTLLDPKTSSESAKAALEEFTSRAKMAALTTNPRLLELHLSNTLLGSMVNTMLSMPLADREISIGLKQFKIGNYPPNVLGTESSRSVSDAVKKDLTDAANAPADRKEAAMGVNANSLNGLLSDLGNKFKLGVPLTETQVQDVVKVVNDINFPEYVKQGKIAPEQLAVSQQAFNHYYNDKVLSKARQSIVGEREIGGKKIKLTDYVDFSFKGNSIVAIPKKTPVSVPTGPGSELNQVAVDMQRVKIEQEARTAARALSSIIVLGSHLEGHTDYKKTWEENKSTVLPELFPPEKTPSKSGKADYSKESNLKGIASGSDNGAGLTAEALAGIDVEQLTAEQRDVLRKALDQIRGL